MEIKRVGGVSSGPLIPWQKQLAEQIYNNLCSNEQLKIVETVNEMKNKKTSYPKDFLSEYRDTGSSTIDTGERWLVTYDETGFYVGRQTGAYSVDDLFNELNYWPAGVKWHGTAASLDELLKNLAEANSLNLTEIRELVGNHSEKIDAPDLRSYLEEEREAIKSGAGVQSLLSKWTALQEGVDIPGAPSPEFGVDAYYNVVSLYFDEGGWTAELLSDEGEDWPELFIPECWQADEFDELFGAGNYWDQSLEDFLPWNRDELAALLIEHDERWRPLVEVDENSSDQDDA